MRGILTAALLCLIAMSLAACYDVNEVEADDRHDAGTGSEADTDTGSEPEGPSLLTEVVFEGEPGGTAWGGFTTVAEDMDGDGLDEVLVLDYGGSVPDTTSYPDARGAVYVFYGRESFDPEYSVLDADAILRGGQEGGTAVGDFDGDGLGDIAYPSRDGVHLIFGSETRLSGELLSTEIGAHLVASPASCDYMKVSGGFDVNGDDLDDLLVDVRWQSSGPDQMKTYLLLGREEPLTSPFSLSGADAVFDGESAGLAFYLGSGMAGDVDGDGFGDVLVPVESAVTEYQDPLAAALFYGGPDAFDGSISPNQADALLESPPFWVTLGGLGDLDQDGFDDFVVSGDSSIPGIYGRGTRFEGVVPISVAEFTMTANADYGYLAGLVTADLNGDTWLDVIVGDPHEATNGFQTGALFVVWGDGSRLAGDLLLDGAYAVKHGLAFEEEQDMGQGENLGYGLGGGGDVNGDGYADILVGAAGDAIGDDYGGCVYMLLGGPAE